MKFHNIVVALLLTASAVAQEPVKAPAPEQLTKTELLAIQTVIEESHKVTDDALQVTEDIKKAHPGYTFSFQTGKFEKLPEPKKPEVKPEVKDKK